MIPELTSLLGTGSKLDAKEVAAKVQGMFTEVMLKAMEDSVEAEDGLFGNSLSSDIYRGMLREHLANAMQSRMNSPLEGLINGELSKPEARSESPRVEPAPVSDNRSAIVPTDLPVDGVVSSPVGWRRDPINGETRYHAGTDIAAPAGSTIRAVAEGRVVESGEKGGYGNAVVVQTDDGRKMLYAHNNKNLVRVGDWVSRGEPIAEVGSTGRATGPHVHFEVKF
jgi:murein DD-endopeptidase MepM/ murein hydrolase activator NlpD